MRGVLGVVSWVLVCKRPVISDGMAAAGNRLLLLHVTGQLRVLSALLSVRHTYEDICYLTSIMHL